MSKCDAFPKEGDRVRVVNTGDAEEGSTGSVILVDLAHPYTHRVAMDGSDLNLWFWHYELETVV